MPTISGDHPDTYTINSTGKKYIFTNTFYGHDSDYISVAEDGNKNTIVMNGVALSVAGYQALSSHGDNVTIRIGAEGVLRGTGSGLRSDGANAHITNDGMIFGGQIYVAVTLTGEDTEFRNRSTITCEGMGISVAGNGSVITNEQGGVIITTSTGNYPIGMVGGVGDAIKFVNHGIVTSPLGQAVMGGQSNDTIRNTGSISGSLALWNGNDLVDTRGGIIRGDIDGGVGDDTLITDNANYKLIENSGQGEDQVKSTVSYTLTPFVENLVLIGKKNINGTGTSDGDRIYGNSGNNTIKGLDGGDTLYGKAGNDTLYGGSGADHFYFNKNYDKDTIADFQQGADKIHVEGWAALSSFAEVKSHASNHGQDVWIKIGDDVLVIKDLHKADLTVDDFVFV